MEDWFFRIVIGVVIAAFIAFTLFIFLYTPRPFHYVGIPTGATCGYEDDGIRTCVADGQVYVCALNWRSRAAQCAPAPGGPRRSQ